MSQIESEEIKQDYLSSLSELTFNSRPIIQNLTIIAQENINYGEAITKAVEEHILKVRTNS
jgi:pre-mRNA cleavage complex 2 protein Pcf11